MTVQISAASVVALGGERRVHGYLDAAFDGGRGGLQLVCQMC